MPDDYNDKIRKAAEESDYKKLDKELEKAEKYSKKNLEEISKKLEGGFSELDAQFGQIEVAAQILFPNDVNSDKIDSLIEETSKELGVNKAGEYDFPEVPTHAIILQQTDSKKVATLPEKEEARGNMVGGLNFPKVPTRKIILKDKTDSGVKEVPQKTESPTRKIEQPEQTPLTVNISQKTKPSDKKSKTSSFKKFLSIFEKVVAQAITGFISIFSNKEESDPEKNTAEEYREKATAVRDDLNGHAKAAEKRTEDITNKRTDFFRERLEKQRQQRNQNNQTQH
ncbi:MAG: hypothetical protein KGP29_07370 [Proteobacteria bacterium]|nr:hypothetical protein [Pseudomonadota bacterium]